MKNSTTFLLFFTITTLLLFTKCRKDNNEIGQPDHAALIENIENQNEYSFTHSFYVRPPGATYGSGDGSSWSNAFTNLPENLIRGARYFLAAGNYDIGEASKGYVWHKFNDEENEDLFIGVFKATASNHGTDDGWATSLGEGVANIGPIEIVTGNYVIDGQVGELNSGHGIKITTRDGDNFEAKLVRFTWDSNSHHVFLKHIDMEHTGNWGFNSLHPAHDAIKGDPVTKGNKLKNLYFISCYIHDANRALLTLLDAEDVLFEKCYFARAGLFQEATSIGIRESKNIVFRRNIFEDTKNNFFSIRAVENVYIYSNIFISKIDDGRWEVYAGIENGEGFGYNLYIYNNTFYNLKGLNCGIRLLTKSAHVYTHNNLWANCLTNRIGLDGEHSHNAFYANFRIKGVDEPAKYDENIEEEDKQVISSNPFVDTTNYNFNLKFATEAGITLDPPFNIDFNGDVRGQDGIWDRGAFEFENQ